MDGSTGEVACICSEEYSGVFCQNAVKALASETTTLKTSASAVVVTDFLDITSTAETYETASGDVITPSYSGDMSTGTSRTRLTISPLTDGLDHTGSGDIWSPTIAPEDSVEKATEGVSTTESTTLLDVTGSLETMSSGESTVSTGPCDRYNPCQNGATCYLDQSTGEVACSCAMGFSGLFCQDAVETEMNATSLETLTSTMSATDTVYEETTETGSGDIMASTSPIDITATSPDVLTATTLSDGLTQIGSGDDLSTALGSEDTEQTASWQANTTAPSTTQLNETSLWDQALSTGSPVSSDPCDIFNPCQNGATCYLDENSGEVACSCPVGFSGVFCKDAIGDESYEMSTLVTSTSTVSVTESMDTTSIEMALETASGDLMTSSSSGDMSTSTSSDSLSRTSVAVGLIETGSGDELSATEVSGDTEVTNSWMVSTSKTSTIRTDDVSISDRQLSEDPTAATLPCDRFNPCQNGATCYLDKNTGEVACSCRAGFSGVFCQDTAEAGLTKPSTLEARTTTTSVTDSMDIASTEESSETFSGDITASTVPDDIRTESATDTEYTTAVFDELGKTGSGDSLSPTVGSGDADETVSENISTTAASTTQLDETSMWEMTFSGESTASIDPCDRFDLCQNGGTCYQDEETGEVACSCPVGFFGGFCQDTVEDKVTEPFTLETSTNTVSMMDSTDSIPTGKASETFSGDIITPTSSGDFKTDTATQTMRTSAVWEELSTTGSSDLLISPSADLVDADEPMSGDMSTTSPLTTQFNDTSELEKTISGKPTVSTDPCGRYNPCQNGATCYLDTATGEVACMCPLGYSGVFCQDIVAAEATETTTLKTSTFTVSEADSVYFTLTEETSETASGDIPTTTSPDIITAESTIDRIRTSTVFEILDTTGSGDVLPPSVGSGDVGEVMSGDTSTITATTTQVGETSMWDRTASGESTVSTDPCDRFNPCQNGATCYLNERSREVACSCPVGFSGVFCEDTVVDERNETSTLETSTGTMSAADSVSGASTEETFETSSGDFITPTASGDIPGSATVAMTTSALAGSDTPGSGDLLSPAVGSGDVIERVGEDISSTAASPTRVDETSIQDRIVPGGTTTPTDPCDSFNPCQNGATCYLDERSGEVACSCPVRFSGVFCQDALENEINETSTLETRSTTVSVTDSVYSTTTEASSGDVITTMSSGDEAADSMRTTSVSSPSDTTSSGDLLSPTVGSGDEDDTQGLDMSTTATSTTPEEETSMWEGVTSGESAVPEGPCDRYNPCQNGATCYRDENTGEVACSCPAGFSGIFCESFVDSDVTQFSSLQTQKTTVSVTDLTDSEFTEETSELLGDDATTPTSSGDIKTDSATVTMYTTSVLEGLITTGSGDVLSSTVGSGDVKETTSGDISTTAASVTQVNETSTWERTASGDSTVSTDLCDRFNPCQNGATCYLNERSREVACSCPVGFSGVFCEDTVVDERNETSTLETSTETVSVADSVSGASREETFETSSGDFITPTASGDILGSTTDAMTTSALDGSDTPGSGDLLSPAVGSGDVKETVGVDISSTTASPTRVDETSIQDRIIPGGTTTPTDPCDRFNPCQNGATCYLDERSGEIACSCPVGFSGVFCQDALEDEINETSTLETRSTTVSVTDSVYSTTSEASSGDVITTMSSGDEATDSMRTTSVSSLSDTTSSGDLLSPTVGSGDGDDIQGLDMSTTATSTTPQEETSMWEGVTSGESTVPEGPCDRYNRCQNGATCYRDENTGEVACSCPAGFSGVFCESFVDSDVTQFSSLQTQKTTVSVTDLIDSAFTEETSELLSDDATTPTSSGDIKTDSATVTMYTTSVLEGLNTTGSGDVLSSTVGSGDVKETTRGDISTTAASVTQVNETSTWERTASRESTVSTDPCDRFNPCQNGATCYLNERSREVACSCPVGFSGVFCEDTVVDETNETSTLETSTGTMSAADSVSGASREETFETSSGDFITPTASGDILGSTTDAMTTSALAGSDTPGSGDLLSPAVGSGDVKETVGEDISSTASPTRVDETSIQDRIIPGGTTTPTDPCDRFNPCQNGATCHLDERSGEIACSCPVGFSGVFCQDALEDEINETSTLETRSTTVSITDSVYSTTSEASSGDVITTMSSGDEATDSMRTTSVSSLSDTTSSGDLLSPTVGSGDEDDTQGLDMSTTATSTTPEEETSMWDGVTSGESTVPVGPCDRYNRCQNGATCYRDENTGEVACSCPAGFSGVFCESFVDSDVTQFSSLQTQKTTVSVMDLSDSAFTEETSELLIDDATAPTSSGDIKTDSATVTMYTTSVLEGLITTGSGDVLSSTVGSGDVKETTSGDISTTAASVTQVNETSTWERTASGESTVSTDPCDRFNPCQNGATCYLNARSREVACSCPVGFSGVFCEDTVVDETNETSTLETSTETVSVADSVSGASREETFETSSGDFITPTASGDIQGSTTDAMTTTSALAGSDTPGSGDLLSPAVGSGDVKETVGEDISSTASPTRVDETSIQDRIIPGGTTTPTDPCDRLNPCQNGATCYLDERSGEIACSCPVGFSGVFCQDALEDEINETSTLETRPTTVSVTDSVYSTTSEASSGDVITTMSSGDEATDSMRTTSVSSLSDTTSSGDLLSPTVGSGDEDDIQGRDMSTTATSTTPEEETSMWEGVTSGESTVPVGPCDRYNRCQNGATCYRDENTGEVACSCPAGFSGVFCESFVDSNVTQFSSLQTQKTTVSVTDLIDSAFTEETSELLIDDATAPTSSGDIKTDSATVTMYTTSVLEGLITTGSGDVLSSTVGSGDVKETSGEISTTAASVTQVNETSSWEKTTPRESTATFIDPCGSFDPCQNGATCYLDENTKEIACSCPKGFSGIFCQNIVGGEVTAQFTFETSTTTALAADSFVITSAEETSETSSGDIITSTSFGAVGTDSPIDSVGTTEVLKESDTTGSGDLLSANVGSGDDETMLGDISTATESTTHVHATSEWEGTTSGEITVSTTPCYRYNPCQNGATCYLDEKTGEVACSCPGEFTGVFCQDTVDDEVTEPSTLETSKSTVSTESVDMTSAVVTFEMASGDLMTPSSSGDSHTMASSDFLVTTTLMQASSGDGLSTTVGSGDTEKTVSVDISTIATTAAPTEETSIMAQTSIGEPTLSIGPCERYNPCQNGATCYLDSNTGEVACNCSVGFSGVFCQNILDGQETGLPTESIHVTNLVETGSGDILTITSSGDMSSVVSTDRLVTTPEMDRLDTGSGDLLSTTMSDSKKTVSEIVSTVGTASTWVSETGEITEMSTFETSTGPDLVEGVTNVTSTEDIYGMVSSDISPTSSGDVMASASPAFSPTTSVLDELTEAGSGTDLSTTMVSGDTEDPVSPAVHTTATLTADLNETSQWDATSAGESTISTDPCDRFNPCQNGATCYLDANTGEVACNCPTNFSGVFCEEVLQEALTEILTAATSSTRIFETASGDIPSSSGESGTVSSYDPLATTISTDGLDHTGSGDLPTTMGSGDTWRTFSGDFRTITASTKQVDETSLTDVVHVGESTPSIDPCDRFNPCQNGATCFLDENTREISCNCPMGFSGTFCRDILEANVTGIPALETSPSLVSVTNIVDGTSLEDTPETATQVSSGDIKVSSSGFLSTTTPRDGTDDMGSGEALFTTTRSGDTEKTVGGDISTEAITTTQMDETRVRDYSFSGESTVSTHLCDRHHPCQNGGTCYVDESTSETVCKCPVGFSGVFCETVVGDETTSTSILESFETASGDIMTATSSGDVRTRLIPEALTTITLIDGSEQTGSGDVFPTTIDSRDTVETWSGDTSTATMETTQVYETSSREEVSPKESTVSIDPCYRYNPCQNGATCYLDKNTKELACSCAPGFSGVFCEHVVKPEVTLRSTLQTITTTVSVTEMEEMTSVEMTTESASGDIMTPAAPQSSTVSSSDARETTTTTNRFDVSGSGDLWPRTIGSGETVGQDGSTTGASVTQMDGTTAWDNTSSGESPVSIDPCDRSTPCLNGGSCYMNENIGEVVCMCPAGFTGVFCENIIDAEETETSTSDAGALAASVTGVANVTRTDETYETGSGEVLVTASDTVTTLTPDSLTRTSPTDGLYQTGSGELLSTTVASGDMEGIMTASTIGMDETIMLNTTSSDKTADLCGRYNPCQNGGTCYVDEGSREIACICSAEFSGVFCENVVEGEVVEKTTGTSTPTVAMDITYQEETADTESSDMMTFASSGGTSATSIVDILPVTTSTHGLDQTGSGDVPITTIGSTDVEETESGDVSTAATSAAELDETIQGDVTSSGESSVSTHPCDRYNPCQNGATCYLDENTEEIACSCPGQYSGVFCEDMVHTESTQTASREGSTSTVSFTDTMDKTSTEEKSETRDDVIITTSDMTATSGPTTMTTALVPDGLDRTGSGDLLSATEETVSGDVWDTTSSGETTASTDPCDRYNPCRNGATCYLDENTRELACICPDGFSGVFCEDFVEREETGSYTSETSISTESVGDQADKLSSEETTETQSDDTISTTSSGDMATTVKSGILTVPTTFRLDHTGSGDGITSGDTEEAVSESIYTTVTSGAEVDGAREGDVTSSGESVASTDPCDGYNPCQNGATCYVNENSGEIGCNCPDQYTGAFCENIVHSESSEAPTPGTTMPTMSMTDRVDTAPTEEILETASGDITTTSSATKTTFRSDILTTSSLAERLDETGSGDLLSTTAGSEGTQETISEIMRTTKTMDEMSTEDGSSLGDSTVSADPCDRFNPCQNGATCFLDDSTGELACSCSDGFSGVFCENIVELIDVSTPESRTLTLPAATTEETTTPEVTATTRSSDSITTAASGDTSTSTRSDILTASAPTLSFDEAGSGDVLTSTIGSGDMEETISGDMPLTTLSAAVIDETSVWNVTASRESTVFTHPCDRYNPCKNGATCYMDEGTREVACICAFGFTGVYCKDLVEAGVTETYTLETRTSAESATVSMDSEDTSEMAGVSIATPSGSGDVRTESSYDVLTVTTTDQSHSGDHVSSSGDMTSVDISSTLSTDILITSAVTAGSDQTGSGEDFSGALASGDTERTMSGFAPTTASTTTKISGTSDLDTTTVGDSAVSSDPCDIFNPCQNGATCYLDENTGEVACRCPVGLRGVFCQDIDTVEITGTQTLETLASTVPVTDSTGIASTELISELASGDITSTSTEGIRPTSSTDAVTTVTVADELKTTGSGNISTPTMESGDTEGTMSGEISAAATTQVDEISLEDATSIETTTFAPFTTTGSGETDSSGLHESVSLTTSTFGATEVFVTTVSGDADLEVPDSSLESGSGDNEQLIPGEVDATFPSSEFTSHSGDVSSQTQTTDVITELSSSGISVTQTFSVTGDDTVFPRDKTTVISPDSSTVGMERTGDTSVSSVVTDATQTEEQAIPERTTTEERTLATDVLGDDLSSSASVSYTPSSRKEASTVGTESDMLTSVMTDSFSTAESSQILTSVPPVNETAQVKDAKTSPKQMYNFTDFYVTGVPTVESSSNFSSEKVTDEPSGYVTKAPAPDLESESRTTPSPWTEEPRQSSGETSGTVDGQTASPAVTAKMTRPAHFTESFQTTTAGAGETLSSLACVSFL